MNPARNSFSVLFSVGASANQRATIDDQCCFAFSKINELHGHHIGKVQTLSGEQKVDLALAKVKPVGLYTVLTIGESSKGLHQAVRTLIKCLGYGMRIGGTVIFRAQKIFALVTLQLKPGKVDDWQTAFPDPVTQKVFTTFGQKKEPRSNTANHNNEADGNGQ